MLKPSQFPGRPGLRMAAVSAPTPIPAAQLEINASATSQAQADQRAASIAAKEGLVHVGFDTVFDLSAYIRNPQDLGGATLPTVLLSYLVPVSRVLKIDRFAVTFSNPIVSMSQCVGWRVVIEGGRVPNINPVTDEYFYSSFGEVNQPLEIEPLWVQANMLIAIEVYPRFGFNQQLTVFGRLSGRLYDTANPNLVGVL